MQYVIHQDSLGLSRGSPHGQRAFRVPWCHSNLSPMVEHGVLPDGLAQFTAYHRSVSTKLRVHRRMTWLWPVVQQQLPTPVPSKGCGGSAISHTLKAHSCHVLHLLIVSKMAAICIIHPEKAATVVVEVSYPCAEEWQLKEQVMSSVWTLDHHRMVSSIKAHLQVQGTQPCLKESQHSVCFIFILGHGLELLKICIINVWLQFVVELQSFALLEIKPNGIEDPVESNVRSPIGRVSPEGRDLGWTPKDSQPDSSNQQFFIGFLIVLAIFKMT